MEGIRLSFLPALEQAEFGRLDQALYTKTILASGTGGVQRSSQVLTTEGQGKRRGGRLLYALPGMIAAVYWPTCSQLRCILT